MGDREQAQPRSQDRAGFRVAWAGIDPSQRLIVYAGTEVPPLANAVRALALKDLCRVRVSDRHAETHR